MKTCVGSWARLAVGAWVAGAGWFAVGCGDAPAVNPAPTPSADAGPGDDGSTTDAPQADAPELDAAQTDAPADQEAGADAGPVMLDPASLPKYVTPLVIPPVMPHKAKTAQRTDYEVEARQFRQQILPTGYPETTVWGYGSVGDPLPGPGIVTTFHSPSFTVEVRRDERVRVKWVNALTDEESKYLPHLLPVDGTLHWAEPGGAHGSEPMAAYDGPVPFVTHVHGAHVASHSDGNPDAWYLPAAVDTPSGFTTKGAAYASVEPTEEGAALFEYTNDQRATTLWYHDHALGITRLNVYAGLAGFWIIRDDEEDALGLPGPGPVLGDPAGTRYYDIPIVIQDRSFHEDGSLFYPTSRAFFDGYEGPYTPETPIAPVWNPEFFGNAMMVNGRTWPYLEVEPRLYRFRLLNGSNARFLILDLDKAGLQFHQIGNEGGLLNSAPLTLEQLLIAPAERFDVIVDFSSLSPGEEVTLLNLGPDEPFKGLGSPEAPPAADPATTGQVMRFKVVAPTGQGVPGAIPASLPAIPPLGAPVETREVTLNEAMYEVADIPVEALLGTSEHGALSWDAPITETPVVNTTEEWLIINLTGDAHPIHLHLVNFQVLDRTPFDAEDYAEAQESFLDGSGTKPVLATYFTGAAVAPHAWENGWKDTVIANPGEVTRIVANFDLEGLYVWHCHILEHEDNEMMRPFEVLPPP